MKRYRNYPGTDTPITAPLSRVECLKCGYLNWHLTTPSICPECGEPIKVTKEEKSNA